MWAITKINSFLILVGKSYKKIIFRFNHMEKSGGREYIFNDFKKMFQEVNRRSTERKILQELF